MMSSTNRLLALVAVALVVVTAGCVTGTAPASDDPTPSPDDESYDADELLEQSIEAESTIDAVHGVQTVTIDDGDRTVSTTQEVWMRAPQDYRAELIESNTDEQFDVMVSNGTTTWMYDEGANEVVRMDLDVDPSELEAFGEELTDALYADMSASITGTDTVADREAHVLELTPEGENATYESVRLWIDQETHYPLKQVSTTTVAGEMTTTVAFEEIDLDADVPDERFTFDPPADAEVIDANDFTTERYDDVDAAEEVVPFDLPRPDVPAGYELDTVMVSENVAGWSAVLQYTDASGAHLSVSVTDADGDRALDPDGEDVEIGDVDATLRDVPNADAAVIEWTADGLTYSVTGELKHGDLIAIVESIVA